jgi:hypothetical protein
MAGRFLVSPLSATELLCHLDAKPDKRRRSPEDAFSFRKANVLKCGYGTMLGGPFAEAAEAVGAKPAEPASFVRELFPQLLDCLRTSNSLSEFYSKTVSDPIWGTRPCADVAVNARAALKVQEEQWRVYVHRVRDDVVERYDLSAFPTEVSEFAQCVFAYIAKFAEGMARDGYPSVGGQTVMPREFDSSALWIGYTLARIRTYEKRRGRNGELVVDLNDFEDASLVRYLDLDRDRVLVTGDLGTVAAVREAVDAINFVTKEATFEVTNPPYVLTTDEFVGRVAGPA